ncbi:MAG: transposase [Lachnospiraceae bacterium]
MEEAGSFGHVYSSNCFKRKIQKIYDDSHQNYGAPKIATELRKSGETITEKQWEIICVKWE